MISPTFNRDTANAADICGHLMACDNEFVRRLEQRVVLTDYSEKVAARAARFEAWAEGALVGLVAVYCNDPTRQAAFITNVSVTPPWKGQGVAGQLLRNALSWLRSTGFARVDLEVDASNAAALRLYARHGFVTSQLTPASATLRLLL